MAVALRIALFFAVMRLIQYFQDPIFGLDTHFVAGRFNLHSVVVLLGGGFILYTSVREIYHMLEMEEAEHET